MPSGTNRSLRLRAFGLALQSWFMVLLALAWSIDVHAGSPFRYDDDLRNFIDGTAGDTVYGRLKYIRLSDTPDSYISFGADVRERLESSDVSLLGFRNRNSDTVLMHRLLAHGDVHIGPWRLFTQLGSELENGRSPSALPTDVNRVDLPQAFIDYRWNSGIGGSAETLRAGRFEMSFDDGALIGLRDGPNVRQSWDGARFIVDSSQLKLDLFDVSPVSVRSGWFDDPSTSRQTLWGSHLETFFQGGLKATAFYYGSLMPHVAIWPKPAEEFTRTFGARVQASRGAFDASLGAIGQTGHLATSDVRAWSAHADLGWSTQAMAWTPHLGVQLDVLSGGDNSRRVVRTFNALYPNYAFSTEATLEAPANLVQPAIKVDVHPTSRVTIQYKIERLWRYSLHDAFYAAPFFPLVVPTGGSKNRYSGSEQQLRASWALNQFVTLTGACVHFSPSSFLRSGHALEETFGMTEIALRL